jgi:hypothetical protein
MWLLLLLLLVLCPTPAAWCLPTRDRLLSLTVRDHGFVCRLGTRLLLHRIWLLLRSICYCWRRHVLLAHGLLHVLLAHGLLLQLLLQLLWLTDCWLNAVRLLLHAALQHSWQLLYRRVC